jgi:hypothetical protein
MLDLFKLHNRTEDVKPKSWIRAEGKDFSLEIRKIIRDIKCKGLSGRKIGYYLSKELGYKSPSRCSAIIHYALKKDIPIPFPMVDELAKLYEKLYDMDNEKLKKRLCEKIEFLSLNVKNSDRIKVVKDLSENLTKIIGAFAADGNLLRKPYKNFGFSYRLLLEDEYKSSVNALNKWFKDVFGISLCIRRNNKNNTWMICTWNKVIFRYFTEFFNFKSGSKVYSIDEPEMIKNSPLEIRKAFACGVLTFDGSVGVDSNVELFIRSKNLAESIFRILRLSKADPILNAKGNFYSVKCLASSDLLDFFEKQTNKWIRVRSLSSGFERGPKDFNEAKDVFKELFNKNNKILIILHTIRNLKSFSIIELTKTLNYKRRTLTTYINFFIRLNVIIKIENFRYKFNNDTIKWKIPSLSLVK